MTAVAESGPLHFALIGTPNSGKTALFNALTGSRQKVANYPGVTVERKSGMLQTPGGHSVNLIDLPGTYSLRARSPDEEVTRDFVLGRFASEAAPDLLLCVADSTNLRLALRQPQVGGVGDAQKKVGRGFRGEAAEHEVARDFLVGRARAQRIGAGQVDQVDTVAAGRLQHAAFALDRDAGIVRDLLAASGQGVKQSGLAAVRRADQREMQRSAFRNSRHVSAHISLRGSPSPRGAGSPPWRH